MTPTEFAELLNALEEAVMDEAVHGLKDPKFKTPERVENLRQEVLDAFAEHFDNSLSSDHSIAIGKHAFRAGFDAGEEWGGNDLYMRGNTTDADAREQAWSAYTPPEEPCGL